MTHHHVYWSSLTDLVWIVWDSIVEVVRDVRDGWWR